MTWRVLGCAPVGITPRFHQLGEWFQYGNIESPAAQGHFQMELLEHDPYLNRVALFEHQRGAVDQVELLGELVGTLLSGWGGLRLGR